MAGGAVITNSAGYNCTARPWYKQAVQKHGLTWSTVFTFASTSPQMGSVTGVTLAGPWYIPGSSNTGAQGVVAVDVDYSTVTPILQAYQQSDMVVYLVETSTYYLVATSSGEVPVVNGKVITATAAKDPVVAQSSAFLTGYVFGNTWAADGSYYTTISGVGYVCNIATYTDSSTSTLAWKLVVCGQELSLPTQNYVTPQATALQYTTADINNQLQQIMTIGNLNNFLAGSLQDTPNSNNLISTATDPLITGTTQQAVWSTWNVYKSMGTPVVSVILFCPETTHALTSSFLS